MRQIVYLQWNTEVKSSEAQVRKRVIKNIVLIPYKPKPTGLVELVSKILLMLLARLLGPLVNNQNQSNEEMVYVPHSPYYSPVHPPTFYEDK